MQVTSWQENIDRVKAELAELALALPPGVDHAALQELGAQVQHKLGTSLPGFLKEFLQMSDGVCFDGVTLYGSRKRSHPELPIPALVDENIALRQHPLRPMGPGLYIGHSDIALFFVDDRDGLVHALDPASFEPIGPGIAGERFLTTLWDDPSG